MPSKLPWYRDVKTFKKVKAKQKQELRQHNFSIASHIPDSTCEHCDMSTEEAETDDGEAFDDNGHPIIQKNLGQMLSGNAAISKPQAQGKEDAPRTAIVSKRESPEQVFRFLDLPAELRNRIYELLFTARKQPVCVRDSLLRPSDDLDLNNILRICSDDVICLPCCLHQVLGTATSGLSRVSKQIHAETALIPYAINTFSVHNLYYLQTFLELIGDKGRKHLKSIIFKWKVPEDEAWSAGMVTSHYEAYRLLVECTSLASMAVEVDAYNLLTRKCDGLLKDQMLGSLLEIPSIELLYELRGLQDIKFAWVQYKDLNGMKEWAESWIVLWRLPRGEWESTPLKETEVDVGSIESVRGSIEYVHWRASGFER